jgi:predicted transcriptional regulator
LGKNRDKISIVGAILETSATGVSKTKIMTTANLSFNLLEKYLDIVTNAGFIHTSGNKYTLTEHGQQFLKAFRHFNERYERAQKLIEGLDSERENLSRLFQEYGLPTDIIKK